MIRFAVVEDDPVHQRTLVGYLRDFFSGREATDVRVFDDGLDFLAALEGGGATDAEGQPAQFDIVFLDIVMARSNGIDVAHRLRKHDANVVIIFVTEAVQYALEGYGVSATDFLVKPLYYTSFCSSMQRALMVLCRRAPTMLQITFDKTVSYLDAGSVYLVETSGKKTLVHALSGEYPCSDTMRTLEERLAPLGFARCHQGFLVNIAFVESVRKSEALVHGRWVPISRYKRDEFVARLIHEVGATV